MNKEMYKSSGSAYLLEAVVGLLTLAAIGAFGEPGLAVIAFIAVRPFVLEKTSMTPEAVREFYLIGRAGIIITFLTILAYYFSAEYIFNIYTDWKIIVIIIFPYFLLSHGIAGMIYSRLKQPD
jgi:hypothetical protein